MKLQLFKIKPYDRIKRKLHEVYPEAPKSPSTKRRFKSFNKELLEALPGANCSEKAPSSEEWDNLVRSLKIAYRKAPDDLKDTIIELVTYTKAIINPHEALLKRSLAAIINRHERGSSRPPKKVCIRLFLKTQESVDPVDLSNTTGEQTSL